MTFKTTSRMTFKTTSIMTLRTLLLAALCIAQSQAHRNGGPVEACRSLVPDHEGMEPLDGASSNYYIEVEPQEDGAIEVVLRGGTFKGRTYEQCDQIWRNLANFLRSNARIESLFRIWQNFVLNFGILLIVLGKIFIAVNGQILDK